MPHTVHTVNLVFSTKLMIFCTSELRTALFSCYCSYGPVEKKGISPSANHYLSSVINGRFPWHFDVKDKLSLSHISWDVMWRAEVMLHAFIALATRGDCSASYPSSFISQKIMPSNCWIGGYMSPSMLFDYT